MLANRHSIVLCLIGVLCISAWVHGRSVSMSMVGDITIDISDNKFICDKIECPAGTQNCVVTKENDPNDDSILVRTDTCYSPTKTVLKDLVTKEAINPKTKVDVHIVANRDGSISVSNSSGSDDFDSEKFKKELAKEMEQLHHNLNSEMESMHKQMSEMQKELANMFH